MKNTTKTILFASLITAIIIPLTGINHAYADHENSASTWQTDIAMRISFCTVNFWASSSLDHPIFV